MVKKKLNFEYNFNYSVVNSAGGTFCSSLEEFLKQTVNDLAEALLKFVPIPGRPIVLDYQDPTCLGLKPLCKCQLIISVESYDEVKKLPKALLRSYVYDDTPYLQ